MKRNGWTQNMRLRLGAGAAALLATVGIYGLVQAQPPAHAKQAGASTAVPSAPPLAPTVVPFPGRNAFGDDPVAPYQPSTTLPNDGGSVAASAPVQGTHTRTRAS